MKSRTLKSLVLGLALLGANAVPRSNASAQSQPSAASGGGTVSINNQAGRVQIKLERGSKVAVSNRYGRITITGWDRDTVEATATGPRGAEAVHVEMTADPQANSSRLTLAVAARARQQPNVYTLAPGAVLTTEQVRELQEVARSQSKLAERYVEQNAKEIEKAAAKALEDKEKEKAKGAAGKGTGTGRGTATTTTPEGGSVIVQPPATAAPRAAVVAPGQAAPAAPAARPGQPTPRPAPAPRAYASGPGGSGRAEEVHLDVKVPRFAQLDTIEVRAGDLTVTNIDGPVSVSGGSSNVTASRIGALTVRTRGGDVNVDGVDGIVYVVAHSGDITVRNAASEVRAMTNNGDIAISCTRGRVDASTAYGKITLANIGGDVDANTTNSEISYTGPITDGGRYRLKSMEGRVVMSIPENSPGFTAQLLSYSRDAKSDFGVRNAAAAPPAGPPAPRRVESHHGNGRTIITLDSFGQTVHLAKLAPGAVAPATCR